MRITAGIAAVALGASGALGQLDITGVERSQFVHAESTLDGSMDLPEGSADFGDYVHTTEVGVGDPWTAWGSGSQDSHVAPDGSLIAGTLIADSLSVVTDANDGFNYTVTNLSLWFTLSSAMDVTIFRDMFLTDTEEGFAYLDLQIWDFTNDTERFRDDRWDNGSYQSLDTVALDAGDYRLTMSVSGEGPYPPSGGVGEHTAHAEVTFDVSFVPAPATTMLGLCACWWVRRRR